MYCISIFYHLIIFYKMYKNQQGIHFLIKLQQNLLRSTHFTTFRSINFIKNTTIDIHSFNLFQSS